MRYEKIEYRTTEVPFKLPKTNEIKLREIQILNSSKSSSGT